MPYSVARCSAGLMPRMWIESDKPRFIGVRRAGRRSPAASTKIGSLPSRDGRVVGVCARELEQRRGGAAVPACRSWRRPCRRSTRTAPRTIARSFLVMTGLRGGVAPTRRPSVPCGAPRSPVEVERFDLPAVAVGHEEERAGDGDFGVGAVGAGGRAVEPNGRHRRGPPAALPSIRTVTLSTLFSGCRPCEGVARVLAERERVDVGSTCWRRRR